MKKFTGIIYLIAAFLSSLSAQTPVYNIIENPISPFYGDSDYSNSVVVNAAGESFTGGSFEGGQVVFGNLSQVNFNSFAYNESTMYVVKHSASGSPIWLRKYGTTAWDELSKLAILPNGNILAVGYTYGNIISNGNTLTNFGLSDMVAICLDKDTGDVIWLRRIGGSSNDSFVDVAVSEDSVYILGRTSSSSLSIGNQNGGVSNLVVSAPTASNGNTLLVRFGMNGDLLGSVRCAGNPSCLDVNKNSVVVGSGFTGTINFGSQTVTCHPPTEGVVRSDAAVLWFSLDGIEQRIEPFGSNFSESVVDLKFEASGKVVVAVNEPTPLPIPIEFSDGTQLICQGVSFLVRMQNVVGASPVVNDIPIFTTGSVKINELNRVGNSSFLVCGRTEGNQVILGNTTLVTDGSPKAVSFRVNAISSAVDVVILGLQNAISDQSEFTSVAYSTTQNRIFLAGFYLGMSSANSWLTVYGQ